MMGGGVRERASVHRLKIQYPVAKFKMRYLPAALQVTLSEKREFLLTLMSFPPDYLAFTGPWIVPLAFLSSILASAA